MSSSECRLIDTVPLTSAVSVVSSEVLHVWHSQLPWHSSFMFRQSTRTFYATVI